jgi:hypothetical protein
MTWRVSWADRARWIGLCTIGEVMGLALGAVWYRTIEQAVGVGDDIIGRIPVWFFLALAGLLEGAVLGSMQAFGLRRIYPRLPVGHWINVTILIAVTGWALGSVYDAFAGPLLARSAPNIIQEALIAAAFGALIGLGYGALQSMALGRAANNAKAWGGASVIAWTLAVPVIAVSARGFAEGASPIDAAIVALAAGLVAGLIVGVVTSFAFQGMPARNTAT